MRYADRLDAHEIFFGATIDQLTLPHGAIENSEKILRELNESGYSAALSKLREHKGLALLAEVSLPSCLQLADCARLALESQGHDLGYDKCLPRSFAITCSLWQAGVAVTLKIGVTRFASHPDSEFHAWTEYRGTPIGAYRETRDVFELIDCITYDDPQRTA